MYIVFDGKANHFEMEKAEICSAALLLRDEKHCELLHSYAKTTTKIVAEASAYHKVTNEMIADAMPFEETKLFEALQKHNKPQNTLVLHNKHNLLEILGKYGFVWQGSIIDTYRVSKHLLRESERYDIDFLFYDLRLYRVMQELKKECGIEGALCLKKAEDDALATELLYRTLLELATPQQMQELGCKPVLLQKFPFGKYSGRYIEEIALQNRAYLEWMLSLEDLDEDLRYSLTHYLKESL